MYSLCIERESVCVCEKKRRVCMGVWCSMWEGVYRRSLCIGLGDDPVFSIFLISFEAVWVFHIFIWMDEDIYLFGQGYLFIWPSYTSFSHHNPSLSLYILPPSLFAPNTSQNIQFERHVNQHKHTFVNIVKRNQLDNLLNRLHLLCKNIHNRVVYVHLVLVY